MFLTLVNDLTFNSMKTALKRIITNKTSIAKDVANQFENLNMMQEESVDQNAKLGKKVNLKDKIGEIVSCVLCDSKMHRAKTCSHKSNYDGSNMVESLSKIEDETVCDEGVNIILLTNKYKILIIEAETNANIDTTCMKTVSGEKWFFIL